MVNNVSKIDCLKFDNGFCLTIPANTKLSEPIHITCVLDEYGRDTVNFSNVVVMEAGSSAEVLVSYCTRSDKPCECSDITEITLGEEAALDIVRLQKVNGATCLTADTVVHQAACSRMRKHFITAGGKKVHNGMKVELAGKHAEHAAFGLSLTQQTEQVNNEILITHASPDCQSSQLFKHILSDTSTGAFTGRIVVKKGAFKTAAYQRSSNILLHPKAKMNICPQLEIYADDVKCSHGATVGQLDAEAMFYMRSRGICETEAKKMLLHAFANEVINTIANEQFRENILCGWG
jgi:Fe-S cluster assembly protein SufD